MPLSAGATLGPYEIVAPIGVGGMGEVYRARDKRLGREVAIKILHEAFARDAGRLARFDREARAVSSLNHPHICILHDIGHHNGIDFLVLEYIEGETLHSRLSKGPLPLEQALHYAIEVAGALATAHRHGVNHRDLKPANIMLTRSGTKLLDFGLARLQASGSSQAQAAASAMATVSEELTQKGTIIGTFQYMAPEQLEAKETDARTDIFAFGLVLYEMLTGRKPFEGKSQAGLIGAILHTDPPPISSLQPLIPAILDRVVSKCLAKDPDERWQNAQDLASELKWIAEGGTAPSGSVVLPPSRPFAWIAVAAASTLAAIALAVLLGVTHFRPAPPAHVVRSSLLPPPNLSFVPYNFAVSPDGTRLAFVAVGPDGKSALWVRAFSSPVGQQLTGGENAMFPFWSSDSHRIGFFADGKLKTADVGGSAVQILAQVQLGLGGTWNRDGAIVFAPSPSGSLYRIPAAGGTPAAATKLSSPSSAQAHRWPAFLPDGKHFLYFVDWSGPADKPGDGVNLGSLDSVEPKQFSAELRGNVAFASGNLLYVRDRSLLAQSFDFARLETVGPVVPIVEQELDKDTAFLQSGFSASENGVLVFHSAADAPSRLVWFDSSGKELGQISEAGYKDPNISPDGRFLAVSSDDERNGKHFIRVHDLERGISTRLTEGGYDEFPTWSRDSRRITYLTGAASGNTISIDEIPADGSGPPQILLKGAMMIPNSRSADGRLAFMDFGNGPAHLAVSSTTSPQPKTFGAVPAPEAQFSPDGKWIAHQTMGGRFGGDITVEPFPGPGARIQISNAGGAQPRWSHDGRRVFYIQADKKLMEASFNPQTGSAGAPRVLFQTRIVASNFVLFQYDVAPDGRFLINSLPSTSSSPLTLLTGWTALLNGR
jgi:serine/threonine protein kinase/Tol biopolymer transport system component